MEDTENNAKYLLAGYNTMNEEERNKFNIKSFVRFFKRFHVLLGISMGLIGAFIHYIYSEITEAIFMITYPCLAYVFMVIYSQKYYKK